MVLLTRPLEQVTQLQSLVQKAGYQSVLFPTLEVRKLEVNRLDNRYDVVIFISVNAVKYGSYLLNSLDNYQLFAIGPATASQLVNQGFRVHAYPQNSASSEALLAIESIKQISGANVLIVRGKGGRETLKEGLSKKNNRVCYAQVYERVQCTLSRAHRSALTEFLSASQNIITITSVESLEAMIILLAELDSRVIGKIKRYPMVVLSQRIKTYALSIGFDQVAVAQYPSDQALVQAIKISKF